MQPLVPLRSLLLDHHPDAAPLLGQMGRELQASTVRANKIRVASSPVARLQQLRVRLSSSCGSHVSVAGPAR